ncbi:hypothetical protein CRUP_034192 [Coryphaenoides rupestris]|nr:hypothetical protein CRUP_034192 [Coryphaenoides rupestris]
MFWTDVVFYSGGDPRRRGTRPETSTQLLLLLKCLPARQTARRRTSAPKPIALEPCFGNKAAVLSIFVRLPRGSGGIPPPGQSDEPLLPHFPTVLECSDVPTEEVEEEEEEEEVVLVVVEVDAVVVEVEAAAVVLREEVMVEVEGVVVVMERLGTLE